MNKIDALTSSVPGWCTSHKAEKLFEIAAEEKCLLAVEIGVYAGKSLIPVALAFSEKKLGRIYAVDPWDSGVATETKTSDENDQWWQNIDLQKIKEGFFQVLISSGLIQFTRIMELPSDEAMGVFQSPRFRGQIDLIHIDGSHSLMQSVTDSVLWLKLLRPGGYIVMDDINWTSVQVAFDFLKNATDMVYISEDEKMGYFAIFTKRAT